MPAGGRDLQRAPRTLLPTHVREIQLRRFGWTAVSLDVRLGLALAPQVGGGLGEMAERNRLDVGERGLGRRLRRTENPRQARASSSLGEREHAADRSQPPVERELADSGVVGEPLARDLPRGGEDRERDREIEAGAFLAQPRRGEVDRDPPQRPLELGGGDAAAHALLRLLAGAVGEPDDREPGHAALEVRLDLDAPRASSPTRACVTVRAST